MITLYNDCTLLLIKIYSINSIRILHVLLSRKFSDIKKHIITFFHYIYIYILLICYWWRKREGIQNCQLQHLIQYSSVEIIEFISQSYWISEHPQPNLRLILGSRCLARQESKSITGSSSSSESSYN